jgi:hypothetical protein
MTKCHDLGPFKSSCKLKQRHICLDIVPEIDDAYPNPCVEEWTSCRVIAYVSSSGFSQLDISINARIAPHVLTCFPLLYNNALEGKDSSKKEKAPNNR